MRRLACVFAAITRALAGCGTSGGAGASAAAPGSSAKASAAKTDDGSAASTNPNDPLGFGKDANTATVTVDGETYASSDLFCVALFGAMGAHSVGSGLGVSIDLPPEDWESSGQDWEPPVDPAQWGRAVRRPAGGWTDGYLVVRDRVRHESGRQLRE